MAGQVETLTVKFNLDDSDFKGKMNSVNSSLGKIPSSANGATSSIKNTALGMLVATGATAGLSLVMGQMGNAIARVDKLNSFPKTLKLIGISAKDAQASTNQLKDGIQGLPTTLQDVTGSTQRLVASGLKIGDATKMTLALNDAMLANGSSTAEAQNAMMQYSQIIATGKVDQQSWNSLVIAMPSALKKVSTELLGAGASQADLKDALQSGTISMSEFNDAMIKADSGTSGFHQQAVEATKGIGTGFQNMKTRITAGLADAINSFNNFVQTVTGSGIGDILSQVGTQIGNALKAGGEALQSVAPQIKSAIQGIVNTMNSLANNNAFKIIATSAIAMAGAIGAIAVGTKIFTALSTAIKGVQTAIAIARTMFIVFNALIQQGTGVMTAFNVATSLNPFTIIAVAVVGAIAGLVAFFTMTKTGQKIWKELTQTVSKFFSGIGQWIGQAVQAVQQFFAQVGQAFAQIGASISAFLAPIVQVIQNVFQVISTIITTYIQIWTTIIRTIVTVITGIIQVIVAIIQAVVQVIVAIVTAIVQIIVTFIQVIVQDIQKIIQVIVQVVQQIFQTIMTFLQPIITFISTMIQQVIVIISTGINAIVNVVRTIIQTVSAILRQVANAVMTILNPIIQIASNIFRNVVNGIRGAFNVAVGVVSGIARNIVNGMQRAFSGAVSTVRSIFDRIKDSITSPLKGINLFDIGANIIRGLVNGIKSMANAVTSAVKGISDGIQSTIKSALSIHSPSRVMRDQVGVFIPAGIAVGIDANAKQAYDSAENMAQGVIDTTNDKMKDFGLFDMSKQRAQAEIDINGSNNLMQTIKNLQTQVEKGQQQSIYLDGTTLVGQTANRMDKQLGSATNTAGRYKF